MYGEAYRPELEPLALSVYNVSKPDDVQPYLKLEQHMQIARALWEFNPSDYYARVQASVPTILAIEAGATPHAQTQAAVDSRCKSNGTKATHEPVERDRDERFVYELTVDLSKLEPTVACHPDPGQRKLAKDLGGVKLDRAYIGSCTGGKTSDFLEFARVLHGKRVAIDTFGVPATPEIVHDLQTARWGQKTVWQILVDAGVQMTENAGCAACLGGPVDTFGRMNSPMKCISATNRNFPGRMGHKESQVFLASPATVAASALTGKITDPREYLPN